MRDSLTYADKDQVTYLCQILKRGSEYPLNASITKLRKTVVLQVWGSSHCFHIPDVQQYVVSEELILLRSEFDGKTFDFTATKHIGSHTTLGIVLGHGDYNWEELSHPIAA